MCNCSRITIITATSPSSPSSLTNTTPLPILVGTCDIQSGLDLVLSPWVVGGFVPDQFTLLTNIAAYRSCRNDPGVSDIQLLNQLEITILSIGIGSSRAFQLAQQLFAVICPYVNRPFGCGL